MRFALSTGSLYTYGLERTFALAAEAGFDGMEVLIDRRFDTRHAAYLQRLMERYSQPILSLHAPFRPEQVHYWPKAQPDSIASAAQLATKVGAEVVVVHLPYWDERDYARWLQSEFSSWQAAHPHPLIVVENMPTKWFRWWPFGPLNPWRMNRLDQWGTFPALNLDTTHLATKGLDPLAVYERLRGQVRHVHLSNAQRDGRRVWEHRRLEEGFLQLDRFLHRLAADDYAGIVTVELHPNALQAHSESKVRRHLARQVAFCRQHG